MGFYINIKCPECGYSFSHGHQRIGIKSSLGLPFLKCPKCKSTLRTGRKVWSTMNESERTEYIFNRVIQTLINAFAIFIILIAINEVLGINYESVGVLASNIVLALVISGIVIYYNSRNIINKLEKIYREKNRKYYFDT